MAGRCDGSRQVGRRDWIGAVTGLESGAAFQVSSSLPMARRRSYLVDARPAPWPPGRGGQMHMAPASSVKIQRGRRAEEKQHVGGEITWEKEKKLNAIGDWECRLAAEI